VPVSRFSLMTGPSSFAAGKCHRLSRDSDDGNGLRQAFRNTYRRTPDKKTQCSLNARLRATTPWPSLIPLNFASTTEREPVPTTLHYLPPRRPAPTWPELRYRDPRLGDLERRILAARLLSKTRFTAERRAVRRELARLVGWSAESRDVILATSDAWHVALNHLLQPRRLRPSVAARPVATRKCA